MTKIFLTLFLKCKSNNETKKLLKFCEKKINDNCLDFHKNKNSVATASLAQVRQPLYSLL